MVAVAIATHQWNRGADTQECAADIYGHGVVPERDRDLFDRNRRRVRTDGRIVHQDIEPAKCVLGLPHQGCH
jgi:hypothetical protein